MDKYDVEYRMYSLKSFCEIFDELFSYDTGDDFWKRCVCEATIRSLSVDMCDGEVNQRPEEVSLRIALKDVVLRRLEPYKNVKPKTIDTNKINEMLQHTIKVFMDDETMKVEDMDGEVNQRPEEVSLRIALKDVVLRRLEPYKNVKPKTIDTNKINEMLQHTIKVFMDDETMKVEDMDGETLHYLCGSFQFLLSQMCPFAYSFDYSQFLKDVQERGVENYADTVVALHMLIEQYKKY